MTAAVNGVRFTPNIAAASLIFLTDTPQTGVLFMLHNLMLPRRSLLLGMGSAALLAPLAGHSFAQDAGLTRIGDPLPELEARLTAGLAKHQAPGGNFAIVRNEGIVWGWSHGMADVATGRPAQLDNLFLMASISKTVTAMLALRLTEEGKLDLDADISTYLGYPVRNPYFPDVPITTRQILMHTTTMLDGDYSEYDKSYAPDILPPSPETLIRTLYAQDSMHYKTPSDYWLPMQPGLAASYCNGAYGAMALIFEAVIEGPAWQYYHDALFKPAGIRDMTLDPLALPRERFMIPYGRMENGAAVGDSLPVNPRVAVGEDWMDEGYSGLVEYSYNYSYAAWADGGIRTSVLGLADLAQVYMNRGSLNGHQVVSSETFEQMLSFDAYYIDDVEPQAIGFQQMRYGPDAYAPKHTGGEYGSRSLLVFDPDLGIAVVGNLNMDNGDGLDPIFMGQFMADARRIFGV
jgi:CubicO group peptidase (beta-lactamase class C family)